MNLQWMPGQRGVRQGARHRACASRTGRTSSWSTCSASASTTRPAAQFTANDYNSINPYTQGSYLNAKNVKYNPNNWLNAALAGIGDGHNGGGPIWAIFDADAVARENWDPAPPNVDIEAGFFFSADTLADLASKIMMKYQRVPMPPENLERTVARYNSFVDSGVDEDFGKPKPLLQDRQAAVLRRLGDAGGARHARRPAHQRQLPGDRYGTAASSRACTAAANRPAASASTASPAPPAKATSPATTRSEPRSEPKPDRLKHERADSFNVEFILSAPFDLELAVIDAGGEHVFAFPCKQSLAGGSTLQIASG